MTSTKGLAVDFDEARIDRIFRDLNQCSFPGAAVGIAIGGRPVYRKGFGLANMELPIVLTPTVRMRIASISKHMTSFAFMLLCEDGRADADDPIGKYLPELPAITGAAQIRQLMGNTSGLHDAYELCHQFSGTSQPVSTEELLSLYLDLDEVNAPPRTAWIYNNGGFLLLSVAIERIAGRSLEEVLRNRIFDPVGMYETRLRRWDSDFLPNSAVAHMTTETGAFEKSNFFGNAWAGEGGVVSTVDDMLRWLTHMDTPVIGSDATWRTMKSAQTLVNGTSTNYGLGLHVQPYRGVQTIYHPGGGLGSSAQMLKVPDAGLDVIVMVNREDIHAMRLGDRILDACLVNLEPARESYRGPRARGVFRSPTTDRVIQLLEKEGCQIVSIDGMDMPVESDADDVLRPVEFFRDVKMTITLVGEREKPSSVLLSDFGTSDELMRCNPPTAPVARVIAARYQSSTGEIEVTVDASAGGSRLLAKGRFGSTVYTLECLADGIWRATSPRLWYHGGILAFDPDHTTFRFYSALSRTRGLRFRRVT